MRSAGPITLVTETVDGAGPRDTGISHAVALAVGSGALGETFRLHRTGDVVAFGRRDVITPGYRQAVEAARRHGFEPVERLAGGRAAVFHTETLAFSWAIPSPVPREGVHARFHVVAEMMAGAFRRLGVEAEVGEVPGEYCPGAYSVNVGGRFKVMGVGQRLVKGAAHIGGVVVVSGTNRLREVLAPVYAALDIEWDPATAGSLIDAVPGIGVDQVADAILAGLAQLGPLIEAPLPPAVRRHGEELAGAHRPTAA